MRSGNILQEIWLDKQNIEKAYTSVNRTDIKEINYKLLSYLEKYEFKKTWMEQYRKDMLQYIKEKHKANNLLPFQFAEDILKVLKEIDSEEQILKRVLSIKCFGDSKYFEKNLENIIIRIIKKYNIENEAQEEYSDEDFLLKVGISKYPEILEFCGNLEGFINNEKIEYKKQTLRKLY